MIVIPPLVRGTPNLPPLRPPVAWWVLAAAVALGTWLRLDQFLDQTLLDDEWHTVHQIVRSRPAEFVLSHGRDDHSIALTVWSWLLAQTVGLSELGMRAPSMLAGLASLVVLPLAFARRADWRVRVVLVSLLAVSPLLVSYSRMARPYALTLLLVLVGFAVLERAVAGGRTRWPLAAAFAVLAALAVWLHAVTAPLVVAPVLALAVRSWRGALPWRSVLGIGALTGCAVALALLPPMIHDAAALAAKAGRDLPRLSTFVGVWHVWLGTSSSWLVGVSLVLAAAGAPAVWRTSQVARWTVLGLGLTLAAILLVRPAWVFNPLTFGRYLLAALPLLLWCIAVGAVRLADALLTRGHVAPGSIASALTPLGLGVSLAAAGWHTSPTPELMRRPNTNTLHYYYQFDYRPTHNPVVAAFDAIELSPFWSSLSAQPPGRVTVAMAPFRFESPAWLGSAWERASRQRVMPGFLSGACVPWLFGEVPLDARFAFRNGVHLADASALERRRIDYVGFDRRATVLDRDGVRRKSPECEAWLRQRFGTPVFEDTDLVVWRAASRG